MGGPYSQRLGFNVGIEADCDGLSVDEKVSNLVAVG